MNLVMSGLDWNRAPIELRERLSFSRARILELDRQIREMPGVEGCVLLSTCNRTELYLSCGEGQALCPDRMLCAAIPVAYEPFAPSFVTRRGEDASRHLMEVAGGLHSLIWGEDQIVTQVKAAIQAAREAQSADAVLETLFRNAAAAGKEMKSQVQLTGVPHSAAQGGVQRLETLLGGLDQKRILVIGNGEMGRLAASLLQQAGSAVTVTLRSYRHGETRVPAGCAVIAYGERYAAMDGADAVVSATASPHYTITAQELSRLDRPPRVLIDLAIPRDIEPQAASLAPGGLYNVDDLGVDTQREIPRQAAEIVEKYLGRLAQWENYRACLPGLERVKQAVAARVIASELEGPEAQELVYLAVSRAVDLLAGGLREGFSPQELQRCAEKIELHNAARPHWRLPEERPLRFPLFVELADKRAVVVGGGAVACRRAKILARFGAQVTLIAPRCEAAGDGMIWEQRCYRPGDLAGAALAVIATDDRAVNRAAGEEARMLGIPVSVADAPEECTFYFPAICAGENLVAGVAGRGDDHLRTARASRAIRAVLEELQ